MYHPPYIVISDEKAKDGELYLDHIYEGRVLKTKYISAVLVGLEFFWGRRVRLETTEYEEVLLTDWWEWYKEGYKQEYRKIRVVYTCENRQVERQVL